ncbi:hypothetical protein ACFOEQ_26480 [Chryseobacterium arachidis]|uniref:hypothetical protein n=1 Tax=Chryseobacterium arachidis TaxID=1416778 RepID=UPI00361BA162
MGQWLQLDCLFQSVVKTQKKKDKLPPAAKNEALSVEKAIKDHVGTGNKKKPADFFTEWLRAL